MPGKKVAPTWIEDGVERIDGHRESLEFVARRVGASAGRLSCRAGGCLLKRIRDGFCRCGRRNEKAMHGGADGRHGQFQFLGDTLPVFKRALNC